MPLQSCRQDGTHSCPPAVLQGGTRAPDSSNMGEPTCALPSQSTFPKWSGLLVPDFIPGYSFSLCTINAVLSLVTSFSAVCVFRLFYFWLRWVFILLHAGFSSCDARAYLPHGMWDIPRPGIEPMSPALAGGFLTTEPPGKSSVSLVFNSGYL